MNKTEKITGILAALLFSLSLFFKAMHWPGSHMILFISVLLLNFIYLPFQLFRDFKTSTRALEKAFKRVAARAHLPEHYSIHCLRHTFACQLYKASGYNLRLVQKQLGHSKAKTTEVYADVLNPDLNKALERLYV